MNRTTSCVPERAHTKPLPESADVGPPVIPSLMSIQTSPPCNDTKSFTNNNTGTSIPSLMSIETRPPSEMRNNETNFQVISAPKINGTTSCMPEGAHTKPLPESADVGPSVIPSVTNMETSPASNDTKTLKNNNNTRTSVPSLMSIETRPPSEMRNNETKFQANSAPRMNRTTSCVPEGAHTKPLPESADVGPSVISSLMSGETSPQSNDTKALTNNNNTRTSIPSLMSIDTRPPWEMRNNEINMSSMDDLQKTVTTQRELINVLIRDRNWLEGENNMKSAAINQLNNTIKEYEKHLKQQEESMALELEKQRGIQKELNENVKHWKNKYHTIKEECKSLKDLNFGGAAQPAEETEVVISTSGEQPLKEIDVSSAKKKKSRAARFRRWLKRWCCCFSSAQEETSF